MDGSIESHKFNSMWTRLNKPVKFNMGIRAIEGPIHIWRVCLYPKGIRSHTARRMIEFLIN